MAAAAGPQRRQEITLLQERSAGTFARVYLAEAHSQDGISRIVAVKILKTQWSSDPELLNRTHDEARLLARLHHRNILRVEALAELDGQPAIIMEFVDGIDLKQIIERTSAPMPARAAYRIVRDTAAALEAAYFRAPYGRDEPLRVIHRDIKPSNVMVSVEGDVKVLDFGTARYQNEIRLAQTGALRFGSLKYMSPERRAGDRGEHSSDIYALAILLLEMLLGELLPVLPLDQADHDAFLQEQLDRVGHLGLPNPEWEQSLRQTLLRMCAFHASHRLDAQQVVQLMRAFADQANGASLDSYAADTIDRLSREIFSNKPKGDFSGRHLTIALTSSGSTPKADAPEPAPLDDLATVTDPIPSGPSPEPATSVSVTPEPEPALSSHQQPVFEEPAFGGAHQIPDSGPSFGGQIGYGEAAAPEPEREPPPKKRNLALIGAVAGLLGMFLAVGLAGAVGAAWYFFIREVPADIGTVTLPSGDTGGITLVPPPELADTFEVTVEAGDETIQWIKVADGSGETLFKADPSHTAALSAGDYTLTAKVVARPKATGTLTVTDASIDLLCSPGDKQTVICDLGAGESLILSP